MGRRMAEWPCETVKNNSIYNPENKYGYKININHPKIRPFYDAYKKKKGAVILSDQERFEFEDAIFKMMERNKS